jgi:hypothetical protein
LTVVKLRWDEPDIVTLLPLQYNAPVSCRIGHPLEIPLHYGAYNELADGPHKLSFEFYIGKKVYTSDVPFVVSPGTKKKIWDRSPCPLNVTWNDNRFFYLDLRNYSLDVIGWSLSRGELADTVPVEGPGLRVLGSRNTRIWHCHLEIT